jgi:hypothetical protein
MSARHLERENSTFIFIFLFFPLLLPLPLCFFLSAVVSVQSAGLLIRTIYTTPPFIQITPCIENLLRYVSSVLRHIFDIGMDPIFGESLSWSRGQK